MPTDPFSEDAIDLIARAARLIPDGARRQRVVRMLCENDSRLEQLVMERLQQGTVSGTPWAGDSAAGPASAGATKAALTWWRGGAKELAGATFGDYRLLEQIGEGGMGVVFMAQSQRDNAELVAIKVMRPGPFTDATLARFRAEADVLSRLEHPGIARFFSAGVTDNGVPYYTMELVQGQPLNRFLKSRRSTVRQRLELCIQICKALQHAHQRGVIHRDLKPSNILVGLEGDRPQPKIIDFGIAKILGDVSADGACVTGFHQVLGTPAYMSPEQADSSWGDIDTRTDVYALGAILYEMLSGLAPIPRAVIAAASPSQYPELICHYNVLAPSQRWRELGDENLRQAICRQRGTTPRLLSRQLCGELDWIVLRALEKEKDRRYQSMEEFSADLQRFLDGRPVLARPPSAWYLLNKYIRRQRAVATLLVALLLVMVFGVASTAYFGRRAIVAGDLARHRARAAQAARIDAERARMRARDEALTASRLLYDANMKLASDALHQGDIGNVINLLRRHDAGDQTQDFRDFAWHYLYRRVDVQPDWLLEEQGEVDAVAFDPRGQYMAAICDNRLVRFYRWSDRVVVGAWEVPERANALVFSPDGAMMLVGTPSGKVLVWDFNAQVRPELESQVAGRLQGELMPMPSPVVETSVDDDEVNSLVFSRDGTHLYAGTDQRRVRRWSIDNDWTKPWEMELEFPEVGRSIKQVALAPDEKLLAAASSDGTLRVWDTRTGSEVFRWTSPETARVTVVDFSSDGRLLAAGDIRGTVVAAQVGTWEYAEWGSLDGIESLAFVRDSSGKFLTGDRGGAVRCWLAEPSASGKMGLQPEEGVLWLAANGRIQSVALQEDNDLVVVGSRDGKIGGWDLRPRLPYREFPAGTSMAVNSEGRIAIGGDRIRCFELEHGEELSCLGDAGSNFLQLSMAARGPYLAAFDGAELHVFDIGTGRPVARWQESNGLWKFQISPDGYWVALADRKEREKVRLVNWQEGVQVEFDAQQCAALAFSPDMQFLAIGELDDAIVVNLQTLHRVARLVGHDSTLTDLAFSPISGVVASVSDDRRLKLWNRATGQEQFSTQAHAAAVGRVVYSDDGKLLVTSGADRRVRLWSTASNQPILELKMPDAIENVYFSSRVQQLLVHLRNGAVRAYLSQ
ncbi:MAG: hypothetical protein D6753_08745 [Planctomycetota bacterium]|nr:MAG: hypothetical protein D6753_08745 [Planctomycetota bacterium]